jgi:hypothetical protein
MSCPKLDGTEHLRGCRPSRVLVALIDDAHDAGSSRSTLFQPGVAAETLITMGAPAGRIFSKAPMRCCCA